MTNTLALILLNKNTLPADDLIETLSSPLILILLQILLILIVAKITGYILSKFGQPQVVGEIAAGILLGPSLLGHYFPGFSEFIFPVKSLKGLQYLSQVGLILFMFVVGLELDFSLLKKEKRAVAIISSASILIPFLFGLMIAYKLYHTFPPKLSHYTSFALFIGISMCITAFPVLARIVYERNMMNIKPGMLSLSCAAANDCAAWFLLASVLAYIHTGNAADAFLRLLFIAAYLGMMLFLIKPLMNRIYIRYHHSLSEKGLLAVALILILFSSILTEVLGIHALFGAFLAGAILSDKKLIKEELIEKIQDVSIVLLLPVFFALTGLRTQVGLLSSGNHWIMFFGILILAIAGKLFSSAFAARYTGQSWSDSLTIGILMNTRGLIELVILNIGYDLGLLQPTLFTILVLMAIVTTFMTGPLLSILQKVYLKKEKSLRE